MNSLFPLQNTLSIRDDETVRGELISNELDSIKNNKITTSDHKHLLILLDDISEYFGIKISFYFAWLGHYTAALTAPAVVGTLFWVRSFMSLKKL